MHEAESHFELQLLQHPEQTQDVQDIAQAHNLG